jgi:uncharacterized protein (TIGR02145 family)
MALFNRQRFALLCAVAVGLAGCGGGDDSYETVTVGGKKWMKRNLNINADSSWCYENSEDSCAKYGRLYTWGAAKSACSLAGSGWRLPTHYNWVALKKAIGGESVAGKKLKAKNGWMAEDVWILNSNGNISGNGTDDYGFSALPGGYRDSKGNFYNAGCDGKWWTESAIGLNVSISEFISLKEDKVYGNSSATNLAFSVRCVKD